MSFLPSAGDAAVVKKVLKHLKVRESDAEITVIFKCFDALISMVEENTKLKKKVSSLEKDIMALKRSR